MSDTSIQDFLQAFKFEFIENEPIHWGNNIYKPISTCKISCIIHPEIFGYGCAYCHHTILSKIFEFFKHRNVETVSASEGQKSSTYAARWLEILKLQRWPDSGNFWLIEPDSDLNSKQLLAEIKNFDPVLESVSLTEISSAMSGIDNALWSFISHKSQENLVETMLRFLNQSSADHQIKPRYSKIETSKLQAYCTILIEHLESEDDYELKNYLRTCLHKALDQNFKAIKIYISRPFGNIETRQKVNPL